MLSGDWALIFDCYERSDDLHFFLICFCCLFLFVIFLVLYLDLSSSMCSSERFFIFLVSVFIDILDPYGA